LADIGFEILATRGTCRFFEQNKIPARAINKVSAGRPHVVDAIMNREIHLVINTGTGDRTRRDGYMIRRAALKFNIPYATTIACARAMGLGIAALNQKALSVAALQDYHH
jgi:carbamoyl-phosphate synthase large subunit